jgi:hypothetical protein
LGLPRDAISLSLYIRHRSGAPWSITVAFLLSSRHPRPRASMALPPCASARRPARLAIPSNIPSARSEAGQGKPLRKEGRPSRVCSSPYHNGRCALLHGRLAVWRCPHQPGRSLCGPRGTRLHIYCMSTPYTNYGTVLYSQVGLHIYDHVFVYFVRLQTYYCVLN